MKKRKNYREQGLRLERKVVNDLKKVVLDLDFKTSRAESKNLDNRGIDIYVSDTQKFPYEIQCKKKLLKTKTKSISIDPLLRLTENQRVLITQLTNQKETNESTIGIFVTLDYNLWLELIEEIYAFRRGDKK